MQAQHIIIIPEKLNFTVAIYETSKKLNLSQAVSSLFPASTREL
jgi:hypothetical protein